MPGRYKKGWSAAHQQVFMAYTAGSTVREIMEQTKYTKNKVNGIIRCKGFQKHHDQVVKDSVGAAQNLLKKELLKAAGQIVRLMKQGKPEERLKFDAAKEILYQCGLKPVEVIETRGREYTKEEIQSSLTVIKEVQAIEEVLSTQGSGFLVRKDKTDSVPVAVPVQATPVANEVAHVG